MSLNLENNVPHKITPPPSFLFRNPKLNMKHRYRSKKFPHFEISQRKISFQKAELFITNHGKLTHYRAFPVELAVQMCQLDRIPMTEVEIVFLGISIYSPQWKRKSDTKSRNKSSQNCTIAP